MADQENLEQNQSTENEPLTTQEKIDLLKGDDKEEETEKKLLPETDEEEDEDEEEKKKDDDEDEEEEDLVDEDLELIVPVKFKEIVAKYPEIEKDFPGLKAVYYRDQQMTQIFPTVDDAREANDKAQQLDEFREDILGGNIETLLNTVKQTNKEAFYKIADDYLDVLYKVDNQAYYHVVANNLRFAMGKMLDDAGKTKNEDRKTALEETVSIMNQFFFGDTEIKAPTRISKEPTEEEKALRKEREDGNNKKFDDAKKSLNGKVDNIIKSTVNSNVDKRNLMPDYVKRNAVRDVMDQVKETMDGDNAFNALLERLWRKHREDNYSSSSLDKIEKAKKGYAKSILPGIIQRVQKDALKGLGQTRREEKDRKGPMQVRRQSGSSKQNESTDKEGPRKGESSLSYLMRKA